MSLTDASGLSASDVLALTANNNILIANMELTYNDCKSEHGEKIIDTAIRMVNQNR